MTVNRYYVSGQILKKVMFSLEIIFSNYCSPGVVNSTNICQNAGCTNKQAGQVCIKRNLRN